MQRPGHTGRKALATKNNIEATLVGEEANPTTLLLMAHICAALDSGPEWLQWVQVPDTLSAAGAAGVHSWGLMPPTSTRTLEVNYTSAVAVRYPPLNREVGDQWIVGAHSLGGLDGLVGGYQLVFCCERLSASMARSLHLRFSLCATSDSHPGPGGNRTAASCQPQA